MHRVFLDTSYALALSFHSDSAHARATQIAAWLERESIAMVTTRAVLLEIGNALSKTRYRRQSIELLDAIEEAVEVIALTDDLYRKGVTLFRKRLDKEWGLVDCISCVVMREQDIRAALTADRHFQQMGFQALLCEG